MPELVVRKQARVAQIVLNRPEAMNAWTMDMQNHIATTVNDLDANTDVDGIVITGAGSRAFCAGQDLHETSKFSPDDVHTWLDGFKAVYGAILSTSKPVVAALNGVAAGSGYQLALLCDIRIAHAGVRMGQPEVKSGIPSIVGHFLTQYCLGHSRTVEMMLSGRLLEAAEAHRIGLIHDIVPRDRVLTEAVSRTHDLANLPKLAFKMTKERIRSYIWPGLLEAFEASIETDRAAWGSGEPQETAKRFFDARAAQPERR